MNRTSDPTSCPDVYVAPIPADVTLTPVLPPERQRLIEQTRNRSAKIRRYWVWKLLERAAGQSFSLSLSDLSFRYRDGVWTCREFCFSLSHSQNAVAVAVSRSPVGVDLEHAGAFAVRFSDPERLRQAARRICTEQELPQIREPDDLLALWTKKESIFKRQSGGTFSPGRIPADSFPTITRAVELPERYLLSLCADMPGQCRLFVVKE